MECPQVHTTMRDESFSYSSEDTKDDSGDFKEKNNSQSFHPKPTRNMNFNNNEYLIQKSSKIIISNKNVNSNSSIINIEESNSISKDIYTKNSENKLTKIFINKNLKTIETDKKIENKIDNKFNKKEKKDLNIEKIKIKEKGKFSLVELKNTNNLDFKEIKQGFSCFNYPFVQDLKGPIFYSKGKSGAMFLAKIRKVQSIINRNVFDKGMKYLYRVPKDVPEIKFWNQRFYYYSKFDEGIKMDYESWYSVTPEDLAFYISKIAGKNAICIDPFAGSGGNVIQFSKNCEKCYAVDIDPVKIDILKNNCAVYKCPNNIEIFHQDILKFNLNSKVIFY